MQYDVFYGDLEAAEDNGPRTETAGASNGLIRELGAQTTPPTLGANSGATIDEGASVTITAAMLDFNDAEQSDSAIRYILTVAATNGTLYRDGVALGLNGTFTQADINNGLVSYTHNGSETTAALFRFSVSDGAGGSVTNQTFSFTVSPVNDAPVFSGLDATPTFVENGAAIVIDADASLFDAELNGVRFEGATLTVHRQGGANTTDSIRVLGSSIGFAGFPGDAIILSNVGGTHDAGRVSYFGGSLIATFGEDATAADINALLCELTFSSSSDTPDASVTLEYTFSDGNSGAQGSGGAGTVTGTITIAITPFDDPRRAVADSPTVLENATATFDVLANDIDLDGGPVATLAQIEGNAMAVGETITLASGARLTLNADGTLTYDPNGIFDDRAAYGTNAANQIGLDSFDYTLSNGNSATVSMIVRGVASPGDLLHGNGGANTITGTVGSDIFMLEDGGNDTANGNGGVDGFYMGGALSQGDWIDGGASNDLLGLQGDYASYTFSATNLVGIETLVLLSGSNTTYSGGAGTARYDYDLTTIDANVVSGQQFLIHATTLLAGEDLRFDGSAETDGSFFFFGGAGDDTLIGGTGNDIFSSAMGQDTLTGNGGADVFYFRTAEESPDIARDAITDFAAGDIINLWALGEASGQGVRFIGDAAFSSVAGQLRVAGSGTSWVVEVDVDGDGGADFAIDVTTTASDYQWSAGDFII